MVPKNEKQSKNDQFIGEKCNNIAVIIGKKCNIVLVYLGEKCNK